jgi:hypothetical protein
MSIGVREEGVLCGASLAQLQKDNAVAGGSERGGQNRGWRTSRTMGAATAVWHQRAGKWRGCCLAQALVDAGLGPIPTSINPFPLIQTICKAPSL